MVTSYIFHFPVAPTAFFLHDDLIHFPLPTLANSYVTQYIVSYVVIPHYVNKINSEYKLVYQNEFYGIYLA